MTRIVAGWSFRQNPIVQAYLNNFSDFYNLLGNNEEMKALREEAIPGLPLTLKDGRNGTLRAHIYWNITVPGRNSSSELLDPGRENYQS